MTNKMSPSRKKTKFDLLAPNVKETETIETAMDEDTTGPTADQTGTGKGPSRRGFLTGAVGLGSTATGLSATTSVVGAEPAKGVAQVNPRLFSFVGGKAGVWSVLSAVAVVGDPLPKVDRLDIVL